MNVRRVRLFPRPTVSPAMTAIAGAVLVLLSIAVGAPAGAATGKVAIHRAARTSAFDWFKATPTPRGWRRLALPSGAAVLSYPPSLHPIKGDKSAVSVALVSGDDFLVYLNATPQQGSERLAGWAAFRVGHLLDDDASSAHEVAAATDLNFRGGRGSCVIDDYVTKIGH
ncbi:MAG: hypothetical protein JWM85_2849, partial [Acidimicrobiaceae bacterium]|nr:hypothetical protein [Acidimicrobiaceae bacterium]